MSDQHEQRAREIVVTHMGWDLPVYQTLIDDIAQEIRTAADHAYAEGVKDQESARDKRWNELYSYLTGTRAQLAAAQAEAARLRDFLRYQTIAIHNVYHTQQGAKYNDWENCTKGVCNDYRAALAPREGEEGG